MEITILFQLLLAHILTDFVFQPNSWVEKKNEYGAKGKYFWIHSFLAGFFTYLFLQQWSAFLVPAVIFLTHAAIDYWKIVQERKTKKIRKLSLFIWDQTLHLMVIVAAWLFLVKGFGKVIPFTVGLLKDQSTL